MGLSRALSVGLGLVVLGSFALSQSSAFAKAKLEDPPPQGSRATGDDVAVDCDGTNGNASKTFPEGATAITVRVSDVDSFGCIQIAVFDGTTRLGTIAQMVDNQPTARTVDFPGVAIPPGCRTGKRCTIHMRQLLTADAGACPAGDALGNGALGNRYSCGDFRVAQPAVPDAAAPPDPVADSSTPAPNPGQDSGFTPIPVPEGTGGGKVSGLNPKDAESEGCSVGNVGAQTTVWGTATAFAGIVAMVGLGLRRRRNRP